MNKTNLSNLLTNLNACSEAIEWSESYGDDYDKAWCECENGDWLVWILGYNKKFDHKKVVRISCKIARLVIHLNSDPRGITCLETVERWLEDKATVEEVVEARKGAYAADAVHATYAAADAAASADAAAAADAAASAAAADAAADAVYAAASAVYAAASAVYVAASAVARKQIRKQIADIVREEYPEPFEVNDPNE